MARKKHRNKNRAKVRKNTLAIVATDNTFEKVSYGGGFAWQGKCIFCNKKLLIGEDGSLINHSTIEHIMPKSRGGTDDIENLAIACRHCNGEKGRRHDINKANKHRALEIVNKLLDKRKQRWRDNFDLEE